MERFGSACVGSLFWIWAAYAAGVSVLSQIAASAHLPALFAWVTAVVLGSAVLALTERL